MGQKGINCYDMKGGYLMNSTTINLTNVAKVYRRDQNRIYGVSNISLSILPGEILGLLGPNGAGKTTLLRIISTLIKCDEGQISFNEKSIDHMGEGELCLIRKQIGYVSEIPFFYSKITGKEYLSFMGKIYGLEENLLRKRLNYYFDLFELGDDQDCFLSTYSQGMLKKIALITSFINDQSILILDEPTSSLDPKMVACLKDLLLEKKKDGKTIIISTHLLDIAEVMSDRICILNVGKLQLIEEISILDSLKRKGIHNKLEQLYLEITS